jgi:hypothetical protein
MTDVERLLADELEELGRAAPHQADLAGAVRRRSRRRTAVLGSAVAVLAVTAGTAVAAVRLRDDPAPVRAASGPATFSCAPLDRGVLPEWARSGFSEPNPRMPHALTGSGRMVAIVFGDPLTAPPRADVSNKILWVLADMPYTAPGGGAGRFYADARLSGSDRTARVDIAQAPGPSGVDLPAPGCWELTLHWGTYTDTIRLAYAPRR